MARVSSLFADLRPDGDRDGARSARNLDGQQAPEIRVELRDDAFEE
jgi:hypothetical protein